MLDQALKEIGWPGKADIQGREIDGWYHGIGFASFVESSAGGAKEKARISAGVEWDAGRVCRRDQLGTGP